MHSLIVHRGILIVLFPDIIIIINIIYIYIYLNIYNNTRSIIIMKYQNYHNNNNEKKNKIIIIRIMKYMVCSKYASRRFEISVRENI